MSVIVCFECQEFTIIRDTKYHKRPENFCDDRDHKKYKYSPQRAAHQDWFERPVGEGFEFKHPELKEEPDFEKGEKETATGKDLYEHIMEVVKHEPEEEEESSSSLSDEASGYVKNSEKAKAEARKENLVK